MSESGSRTDAPRQLRGVILDMDGVLVQSEPHLARAMVRLFAERGAAVTPEEVRSFVGMGEDRVLGEIATRHRVAIDLGSDKDRLYAIYLEIVRGRLGPAPGAREFIQACRERGLRVAVATSADDVKVEGNLSELGLPASAFDAVVTGSQVARKKPHPDLFLEAARRLGLPASACLVVEDAVAGVAAAHAAGSRCLALTTTFTAEELAEADWIAPDLAHAPSGPLAW